MSHPSQEAVVEDVLKRFDNLLAVLGEQDDKKVAGINKRIWLKETLTEVLPTYAQTIRDEEYQRFQYLIKYERSYDT